MIHRIIKVSRYLLEWLDSIKDIIVCGTVLTKYAAPVAEGSTCTLSTPYRVLDELFSDASFSEKDSFVDVGCGRGRVLAYLINKKFPGKMTGVELNDDIATFASNWASKYSNIAIISGDAFALDYNNYSVIYMGQPFEPDLFYRFIEYLEKNLHHSVRLFYWVEQYSGGFLDNRKGWSLSKRDELIYSKGFFCCITPQRYSVWEYIP